MIFDVICKIEATYPQIRKVMEGGTYGNHAQKAVEGNAHVKLPVTKYHGQLLSDSIHAIAFF